MFNSIQKAVNSRSSVLLLSLAVAAVILVNAATVSGHAAVLWCFVENDRVYVEAFFMSGKKVQTSKIIVVDAKGEVILEGMTNKKGLFDFIPPIKDDMTIILEIDSAHGSDFKLTKQDFLDAEPQ